MEFSLRTLIIIVVILIAAFIILSLIMTWSTGSDMLANNFFEWINEMINAGGVSSIEQTPK